MVHGRVCDQVEYWVGFRGIWGIVGYANGLYW